MSPISKKQAKLVVGTGLLALLVGLVVYIAKPDHKPPVNDRLVIKKSKYTRCRPKEEDRDEA